LDGITVQVENVAPFTIAGNHGSNYYPWTTSPGWHVLSVTPYSRSGRGGIEGNSKTVRFRVVGPVLRGLEVVRATNGTALASLSNGSTIDRAIPLSVRADASAESVAFRLDGRLIHIENTAPYSIAGNHGNVYTPWTPSLGWHLLEVIPYSQSDGKGTSGNSIKVTLKVVN
jgi:hypothetical protein